MAAITFTPLVINGVAMDKRAMYNEHYAMAVANAAATTGGVSPNTLVWAHLVAGLVARLPHLVRAMDKDARAFDLAMAQANAQRAFQYERDAEDYAMDGPQPDTCPKCGYDWCPGDCNGKRNIPFAQLQAEAAAEDQDPLTARIMAELGYCQLECDSCGDMVILVTHPRDLVIVLCAACNNGIAVR